MDTGTPHMAGARGRQASPRDDRIGWSAPLLRLIHCHPFLSPSALTISSHTIHESYQIFFSSLSPKGAYHPVSRTPETQPGGVHQVSEVGFSPHSAFDCLWDPGHVSSPLGVPKCTRKGLARLVIFKG